MEAEQKDVTLERIEENLVLDTIGLESGRKGQLFESGLQTIRDGKVTVVVLAGGSGSRLGFDHPKGMYDVGLPSGKSIFQILTERFLKAMMLAHGTDELTKSCQTCKLMIMTSAINHNETVEFFKKNKNFGAEDSTIVFF